MPTRKEVFENLDTVMVPGALRSLVKMSLVRDVSVTDGRVDITLSSAALMEEVQEWLRGRIEDSTLGLSGVNEVNINFIDSTPKELNEIGSIIAVMSGKGGVGKSLVSSLMAIVLQRQGYEVGILDADITGPSIPKMFGIKARPVGSETGIIPVSTVLGIEVMSINLLLNSEDDAVIWRGPIIAGAIKQFWEEVLWGKLDYLIVDLPPGTADAPLTVMQTLPVSGVIIVFTPQELTAMVVRKAVNMAQKMEKPILGVIENMSYLYIPEIDRKMEVFGKSRGEEMAQAANAPLLGQLPLDPELVKLCDEGNIEHYNAGIMTSLGESLSQVLPVNTSTGDESD
jgi:Mrp family chromosome partitioning ATPase